MRFITKIPDMSALKDMYKNYERVKNQHFKTAMERAVLVVKGNVQSGIPTGASGSTRSSITSQVISGPGSTVGKGGSVVGKVGSSMRSPNISVYVLNAGRKPGGKMPPPGALIKWLGVGTAGQTLQQTAFLIARSIGRKGTKGLHYFQKGLQASKSSIDALFQEAVNRITEDLASKSK
jgi:hypothetical protein